MAILEIDLTKIKQNTSNLKRALNGLQIVGVIKACAGDLKIAKAMAEGGIEVIADSRIENFELIQDISVKRMLLRAPFVGEPWGLMNVIDFVIISNLDELNRLKRFYEGSRKIGLIINVETGFGREGFDPRQLKIVIDKIAGMGQPYYLKGFSTNTACKNGTDPLKQLNYFVDIVYSFAQTPGPRPQTLVVSGGNSSVLPSALANRLPAIINQLRVGEAILLGHDTVKYKQVASNNSDAFRLRAEVLQQNSDKAKNRAILAVGYQDIGAGNLKAAQPGIKKTINIYSEHCVVQLNDDVCLGKMVSFQPDYYALLALMTSPYVKKIYINSK